ncbi:hypothetical protein ABZS71_22330 [Streptomyces sp. NPDC005393]|uniref:hypothetical protein n=1 Tax=Streptomyces sp. NPDC005393 TaxID=3157041 RepID=UPI0033BF0ED4
MGDGVAEVREQRGAQVDAAEFDDVATAERTGDRNDARQAGPVDGEEEAEGGRFRRGW